MIGNVQLSEVMCKRVRGSECFQSLTEQRGSKNKSLIYKQNNNTYNLMFIGPCIIFIVE